jgi:hypothetical protein
MKIRFLVISATLVCFGAASAYAQSSSPPAAGASNSNISASTHCRDSNGQPRLKTAANPSGAGSASPASPSSSPSSPPAASGSSGNTSGNTTGSASTGATASSTESLPNC